MDYPKQCNKTDKSGMDKIYYHTNNDYWGWLEFKNANQLKKENSIVSYNNLKKVADIHLPKIKIVTENDYPELEVPLDKYKKTVWDRPKSDNSSGEWEKAKCGYFIQHLDIEKSFKPKMCAYSPDSVTLNIWGIISSNDINQSLDDMEAIKNHFNEIVQVTSELTLAFEKKEHKIFLLDFEKSERVDGIDGVKKGIENIIKVLKNKLKGI